MKASIGILLLVGLSACGRSQVEQVPASEVFSGVRTTASTNAFADELGLENSDEYLIKMKKSFLEEAFLLSMSSIPQKGAATSTGLAGKVVFFKLFGEVLDMYELNDGNTVTDSLPASTLLAQFPVKTQDDESVTFDFDAGMKDVYSGVWYDSNGQFNDVDSTFDVRASRVFEVKKVDDLLLIRHSVLARSAALMSQGNAPYEMRYYLTRPTKGTFKSKEIGSLKNVGYFAVPTKLEKLSGRAVNHAIRFDISGEPITFYYSANTPEDYVEAVKDGVLYWNKAFGSEIVKVAKAPVGVTAPDPKHNVIQWVEWDEAGFAYADVLANPLSGESLHGQVYMTSVFAFKSRERVRRLLRMLETVERKGGSNKKAILVPSFAQPAVSCQKFSHEKFAGQLKSSLSRIVSNVEISDAVIYKVSQDYVREVIGHEVGHVLGLRHNFAGSDAGNMKPEEKKEWLSAYLEGKAKIDEAKVPVTTVMDYSTPIDAYYLGWYMRNSKVALPYDAAAIKWGYFDDKAVIDENTLFCTDDHVSLYSDCNLFDQGPNIADVTKSQIEEQISKVPFDLLESFIASKTAYHPSLVVEVKDKVVKPQAYGAALVAPMGRFFERLNPTRAVLKQNRTVSAVGPLTRDEILTNRVENIQEQLQELGGVEKLIFAYLPELGSSSKGQDKPSSKPDGSTESSGRVSAAEWTAVFNAALESETYDEFIGGDGKMHQFTDEEKEYLKKVAPKIFEEIENSVVTSFLSLFKGARTDLMTASNGGLVADDDPSSVIQKKLMGMIDQIVLSTDKEKKVEGTLLDAGVWVNDFIFTQQTRELAVGTLSQYNGNFSGWSAKLKKSLGERLKKHVEKSLNSSRIKDFKAEMLSPTLLHWYSNQKKIAGQLGASL